SPLSDAQAQVVSWLLSARWYRPAGHELSAKSSRAGPPASRSGRMGWGDVVARGRTGPLLPAGLGGQAGRSARPPGGHEWTAARRPPGPASAAAVQWIWVERTAPSWESRTRASAMAVSPAAHSASRSE